jgi:hypothetical protein
MTVADFTPADAVLIAIDIAKVRNEVLIEASGQKRRRRLSVLNSRTEHDRDGEGRRCAYPVFAMDETFSPCRWKPPGSAIRLDQRHAARACWRTERL